MIAESASAVAVLAARPDVLLQQHRCGLSDKQIPSAWLVLKPLVLHAAHDLFELIAPTRAIPLTPPPSRTRSANIVSPVSLVTSPAGQQ